MSSAKRPNGVPRKPVVQFQRPPAFRRANTTWTQAARRTPRHGHSR